MQSTYSTTKV